MTTPAPTQTEYYKGYDDPTADMVLEVKGGVKFRVHSYLLKAHSQFFRNMPDHDEKLCGTSPKDITFEAEPVDLALLLDLIDSRVITESHEWSQFEAVVKLGITFQFTHLVTILIQQLKVIAPAGDPWATFVLCTKHGHADLAQRLLVDFGRTHLWASTADEVKPKQLDELTGPCATALLRAMRHNEGGSRCIRHPLTDELRQQRSVRWLGASSDFDMAD